MISDIGSDSRSSSETIEDAFHRYQKSLEKVESLRDSVAMDLRRLERCERTINGKLQCIHLPDGLNKLNQICGEAESMFDEVRIIAKTLADNVKLGDIPEFHKMYESILQSLIFDKCLIAFCKERKLLTFEVVASSLGVSTDHTVSVHLTLQDYLLGLLLLPAELVCCLIYRSLANFS
ncbi:Translin domain containing protein [Trichuris trichiura]|uniref:Translin domain containing protein n=1 Tax=Trichuris trichiura TaxID=36087 RepID=A0A077Z979_TRITR|nr:Translin domain containing protein [Trichuris trichiura]